MPLFTKSSQLEREPSDGIRICIMRRPEVSVDWDIWMRELAPSHALLNAWHAQELTKADFDMRFTNEVLIPKLEYLKILIEIARYHIVTILCFEIDPLTCHRYLVAQECKRLALDLEVIIR